MDNVSAKTGSPMMEMGDSPGQAERYIPKQFDVDKLMSIPKDEREILLALMTSNNGMFREETQTTLKSYGLIIDQREGNINQLLNENSN